MNQSIKLTWATAINGYRIENPSTSTEANCFCAIFYAGDYYEYQNPGASYEIVVPRNRRTRRYELELGKTNVLCELANAIPTPAGSVAFANKWGLLKNISGSHTGDPVDQFYRLGSLAWFCLHMMSAGRWSEVDDFLSGKSLSAGRLRLADGGQSVVREATDLMHFCTLELFDMVAQRAAVLRCPRRGCYGFFRPIRRTRKTCSCTCRKALSKERLKSSATSAHLDIDKQREIYDLWTQNSQMLIATPLKRAFVSADDCSLPPDPSFLKMIAHHLINPPENDAVDDALRQLRCNGMIVGT